MNKSATYAGQHILSQILSLYPKNEIAHLFAKAKSDNKDKRLKSWEHFVTMMFSVLSRSTWLLETCMGLEAYEGKLNNINNQVAPARGTLCDANKQRQASVFQAVFKLAAHGCPLGCRTKPGL